MSSSANYAKIFLYLARIVCGFLVVFTIADPKRGSLVYTEADWAGLDSVIVLAD